LAGHLDEDGRRYLGELATLDDLRSTPPDDAEIMRPYPTILDLVGLDGVPLTSAGYLPPAQTSQLFAALGYDDRWRGMGTREASTPPVGLVREDAQALGLVRRHGGRLVRTPAGRATAEDPRGLWDHVASHLPLGRQDHERDADVLILLCLGPDPTLDACSTSTPVGCSSSPAGRWTTTIGWRTSPSAGRGPPGSP
jgi:hypothetical protein